MLTDLYQTSNLKLGYYELLCLASTVRSTISVTAEQSKAAEVMTRDQCNSRLWFRMRAGRITASKFKSVCSTDLASPSLSLIMSICHPEMFRFKTAATTWGCQHETVALDEYKNQESTHHRDLKVSPAGLYNISTIYPFIAATPDAIVSCSCCGQGICEVKVCIHIHVHV